MHASGPRPGSRRGPRRWSGVLVLPLLAGIAGACGTSPPGAASGPPPGTPRSVVLAAAQRTETADTATFSLHVSISGTPDLGSLFPGAKGTPATPVAADITGSGGFDFVHKSGTLDLTVTNTKAASRTAQVRIIGSDVYVSSPELPALTGGKPWVHVDAGAYLRGQGQGSGALGGFQAGDPTKVLDLLQKLSGTVTQVGPETIGGVPTTHYRGTVDLASPTSGSGSSAFGQRFAQLFGFGSVPVDVWVDSAGRARRLEVTISLFGITAKAQDDLGDFGAPVVVTPPPANDVADGTALLQSGRLKSLLGQSTA